VSTLAPFATIGYRDRQALSDWTGVHALRHITYAKRMHQLGHAIATPILDGHIDHDWWGRHAIAHSSIARSVGGSTINLSAGWHDEHTFYDWMRRHTLLHQYTDEQLALVT
jgi:hypothetical protein